MDFDPAHQRRTHSDSGDARWSPTDLVGDHSVVGKNDSSVVCSSDKTEWMVAPIVFDKKELCRTDYLLSVSST